MPAAILVILIATPQLSPQDATFVSGSEEVLTRATESWTVLSYMNGEDNLEKFIVGDLQEMERIGSSENVDIVVQIDLGTNEWYSSSVATWSDTRRYHVQYDLDDGIGSTRVDDPELGEVNMDDPNSLREFIEWGMTSYPADHYMIALEGHAGGPARGLMEDKSSTLGGNRLMDTHEMGQAIRNAIDNVGEGPVDIISFDVCWMGMAEAAAEVMDHSEYMVGSFDEIPGEGWPYDRCLGMILNDTTIPMEDRLQGVVEEFMAHYDPEGSNSYASLVAIDLKEFKGSLLPALSELTEEMFYSAYSHKEVYRSILALLDKPRARNDNDWDRYVDLYQMAELLSLDTRLPERVRGSAARVLDSEDGTIVRSLGGSNHPDSSRLFGIYYPTIRNDQARYGALVMSDLSAWDEHAALIVEELDIQARRVNWTYPNPGTILFELSSLTPSLVKGVELEVILDGASENYTLPGQGGYYGKNVNVNGVSSIKYKFTVTGLYDNSIELPPDGYSIANISLEDRPPEIWHMAPDVVQMTTNGGGIHFLVRDDTGIEKQDIQKIARLQYREVGETSWYSIPLVEVDHDTFRGWLEFKGIPTGITPGNEFEYHFLVSDVYGNQARYPSTGEVTSKMAGGKRFYLDGYHSLITDHSLLLDRFSDMGMSVHAGFEAELPDLAEYKGYILIEPAEDISPADAQAILDFHSGGGELLIIFDPKENQQEVNARWLLDRLGVSLTDEGSVQGFYPSDPNSDLGDTLPTIAGTSCGSLVPGDGMHPVYYTVPPDVAMMTGWYGMGKSVISIHCLLNDDVMDLNANRILSELVISFLQENTLPEIGLEVDPIGVITPGQKLTIDLSSSHDRDGEIVSYGITFSDNTVVEGSDPIFTHTFVEAGVYTAVISITDAEDGVASTILSIKVNRPPSTDHGISDKTIHAGETVIFDYKGNDPDGDEVMVVWDFGDGFKVGGKSVSHTYMQRGSYTYTLIVRDSNSIEVNRTGTITVENSIPEAIIDREGVRVNSGPANYTGASKVTLKVFEGDVIYIPGDLSNDVDRNDVLNYTWDMGDGSTLYGDVVTHVFQFSGLFSVELIVDDHFGGSSNITLLVSVTNRAPFSSFKTEDIGNGKVRFDASASTDDQWDIDELIYIWDLGDGNEITTEDPVHIHDYAFGGTFKVKLTVKDKDGASDTFTKEVDVEGLAVLEVLSILLVIMIVLGVAGVVGIMFMKKRLDRQGIGIMDIIKKRLPEGDEHGFSQPVPVERRDGNVRTFAGQLDEGPKGRGSKRRTDGQ